MAVTGGTEFREEVEETLPTGVKKKRQPFWAAARRLSLSVDYFLVPGDGAGAGAFLAGGFVPGFGAGFLPAGAPLGLIRLAASAALNGYSFVDDSVFSSAFRAMSTRRF